MDIVKTLINRVFLVFALASSDALVSAAELNVGPNQHFERIEDALVQALPGDIIAVYPQPRHQVYEKVAVVVDKPRITIRSAAPAGLRVSLSGSNFNFLGQGSLSRAVVQFNKNADGCVLEGFEIFGAHNKSHNGAGVRINQANNITVSGCEIHDNDMGLISNGDGTLESAMNQRIEHCVIHHNGDRSDPGYSHNVYLGGASVTLTNCEIYSSLAGHNIKSRAHKIEVRDCYIHDSANRELDLVDAPETAFPDSDAVVAGNKIIKATDCPGNREVINFGQDGGNTRNGTLRLDNNVIRTPFISPVIHLSALRARVMLCQNTIENSGSQKSRQQLIEAGSSAALDAVQGDANKISASFAGPALEALKLEHTMLTNPTLP